MCQATPFLRFFQGGSLDCRVHGKAKNYASRGELRYSRPVSSFFRTRVAIACGVAGFALAKPAFADPSSTTIEQGYDLGEIQAPRQLGMGGAQTALGTSTSAVYNNPANMPFSRVYHFEGIAAFSPEARRQSYGGAVVDSSTSRLAGGFGGTWSMMDPEGIRRSWTDLRLALAYPLGDKLAVGATGRYLRTSQSRGEGPLGASLASGGTPGEPIFNAFTFDAGATLAPAGGLRLAVLGKNLTAPGTSLAPVTATGGIGYLGERFALEFNALFDFTTYSETRGRYMFGGELFIADRIPIRLGYRYDDGQKTQAVSLGLGYVDKRWSFEVGGRRDIVADHPSTTIGAAIRIFYEAASAGDDAGDVGY